MTSSSQAPSRSRKIEIVSFITYAVCSISLGLGMAALGPMLPYLADTVGVTIAQISFLFTASSLGYLTGSTGGGRLLDRFKGHPMMLVALGLMIVMGFFIPVVPWFYLLLVVMFLFGLGMGTLDVGCNVSLLWIFQARVGPYMNALHFFFGVGAFLAPLILSTVLRLSGGAITWPYWSLALLFIPGMIGLFLLPSPENPEGEADESSKTRINYRLVGLIMVLLFIYVGVEAGFGGWIFTYAYKLNIADEAGASLMNSLYWGALTLGRLVSIPLARRMKPATLLLGNFVLTIFFLIGFLIWPVDPSMVWIGSAGLGFALSSVFPTVLALGESRMKITGGVTGLFFMGSSLGGMVLPTALGQIFEHVGHYALIVTLFAATLVGSVVLIALIVVSNRMGEKARVRENGVPVH